METPPQVLGLLKNFFLGPHLDIADQFPGEMLKDKRADGGTGTAIKTLQGRVHAVRFELFSKIGVD